MIIGVRNLTLRGYEADQTIAVRIFAPELDRADWKCRYEIEWPSGTRKSHAFGVDAIQALHLVLLRIGSEIYSSKYHDSGHLYFEEPGKGYGFPVPANIRHVLIGDDKRFNG